MKKTQNTLLSMMLIQILLLSACSQTNDAGDLAKKPSANECAGKQGANCPQLMPPAPSLEENCQKQGGNLAPNYDANCCVRGYSCSASDSQSKNLPVQNATQSTQPQPCKSEGDFCGGIAGIMCCSGLICKLDGSYPDAGGKCVNESSEESKQIDSISFINKIELDEGARPEIVVANDRVFIIYLHPAGQSTSFRVSIYNSDLSEQISSKDIVTPTAEYGKPTDIRVASDGEYLYAFYETVIMGDAAHLFGAKYTLDDRFERVAYTATPIASGSTFGSHKKGDELVNDPISLVGPNSVFVITRIKGNSAAKSEPTVYRAYEFSTDLMQKISRFDIDLSEVADGEARQASAIYSDGNYYMVVPTTSGEGGETADVATQSDLLMVKFGTDWKILESMLISTDPNDVETFSTGFQELNGNYFLAYMQNWFDATTEFSAALKVYDNDFNQKFHETVKKVNPREDTVAKPGLFVTDDKIYVALSKGTPVPPPGAGTTQKITNNAKIEIYIYQIDWKNN